MLRQLNFESLFSLIKEKIFSSQVSPSKALNNSYTKDLFESGVAKIAQKVGEEATEVVIASLIHERKPNPQSRDELIGEFCDLFYHTLILMAAQKIELSEIFVELNNRNESRNLISKESQIENKS